MTREEARADLMLAQADISYRPKDDSIDMAIEALKQEPFNDVISRQAVLKMAYDMSEIDGEHFTEPCIVVDVEDIQKLPPVTPQPKTGHWIPVSERLPEDKQSVLVWCPQYKNIYCAYLEKEQWWIFGAFVQIVPNGVVAWMPLPEPYKAESEE